jgi:hypothetical protein
MAGRSPVVASQEQREALAELASSRDRAEADRARAILLTLEGWTSAHIGAAFSVREDVVRDWRSTFMREGVEGGSVANFGCGRGGIGTTTWFMPPENRTAALDAIFLSRATAPCGSCA